jgi:hypothetical protein
MNICGLLLGSISDLICNPKKKLDNLLMVRTNSITTIRTTNIKFDENTFRKMEENHVLSKQLNEEIIKYQTILNNSPLLPEEVKNTIRLRIFQNRQLLDKIKPNYCDYS